MAQDWTAAIAGERMELDGEFADRVATSSLSSQQWNLVMTAVTFEVENPADPEAARLVADTSNLGAIEGELDRIEEATPGGEPSGGGGEGFLSRVFGGFAGGGGDDDRLDEAETMAAEYATRLQEKLEERGRWGSVRERAATE